ncbi:hypothetical protein [Anaerofustis sp.]|uniref:hypothetical protein n=1 Tax=Anaerofustis sp. TaxID=1872517 RepID=UPI0025BA8B8E|nr:hypothetical protein [Anaerofustis sp.]
MNYDILIYNGKFHTFENPFDFYKSMLIKNGKIVKLYKENYIEDDINLKNDIKDIVDLHGQIAIPSFISNPVYILPLILFISNPSESFNDIHKAEKYYQILTKEEKEKIIKKAIKYFIYNGISTVIIKEDKRKYSINNKLTEYIKKHLNIMFIPEDKNSLCNHKIHNVHQELYPLNKIKKDIKSGMDSYMAFKKELYLQKRYMNFNCNIGLIKENYYANFTILSKNLFLLNKDNVEPIVPIKTFVFGKEMIKKTN